MPGMKTGAVRRDAGDVEGSGGVRDSIDTPTFEIFIAKESH